MAYLIVSIFCLNDNLWAITLFHFYLIKNRYDLSDIPLLYLGLVAEQEYDGLR
ncbi:hypothetical protein D3C78_1853970 [compost metagenome]